MCWAMSRSLIPCSNVLSCNACAVKGKHSETGSLRMESEYHRAKNEHKGKRPPAKSVLLHQCGLVAPSVVRSYTPRPAWVSMYVKLSGSSQLSVLSL